VASYSRLCKWEHVNTNDSSNVQMMIKMNVKLNKSRITIKRSITDVDFINFLKYA